MNTYLLKRQILDIVMPKESRQVQRLPLSLMFLVMTLCLCKHSSTVKGNSCLMYTKICFLITVAFKHSVCVIMNAQWSYKYKFIIYISRGRNFPVQNWKKQQQHIWHGKWIPCAQIPIYRIRMTETPNHN